MHPTKSIAWSLILGLAGTAVFGAEPARSTSRSSKIVPVQYQTGVDVPSYEQPPVMPAPQPELYDTSINEVGGAYCEEPVVSPTWTKWYSKLSGCRKSPFQKYNHHPGDLDARPVISPLVSSTYGYHETCWRQFPPVPACPPNCPPTYSSKATNVKSSVAQRSTATPTREPAVGRSRLTAPTLTQR